MFGAYVSYADQGGLNPTVTHCHLAHDPEIHNRFDPVYRHFPRSAPAPPKLASLASITSARPTGWLS